MAELDDDGGLRALIGHYARHNLQVATFERDPSALILFGGPHGYAWAAGRSVEATFKLGQDEPPTTFEEIVAGYDNRALAPLMRAERTD